MGRTVDSIKAAGITELVVVTGYRGEMIRSFLTDNYKDMQISFVDNVDYQTTNNIYSLWLAKDYVAVNTHKLGEEEIKVITDDKGKVIEISKVCSIEKAIGESVGIEKMQADYSDALFKELSVMIEHEKLVDVFYERAFERLIPQGHLFGVVNTTDIFSIELDTVEDFNQAKQLIPENIY